MSYCKSRYYVPRWCRWLNGDNIVCFKAQTINGMNLFSYCQNNPITYVDENGWSFDAEKAANGCMLGTITGAISGAVSGGLSEGFTFAGHFVEKGSYVIRGIKAGVDGLLAMGSYMTQCAMSGSEISVVGSFISLGTGLLSFVDPMGKIDSILIPTIGAELAWGYDMISKAIKKENQKFSVVY